MQTHKKTYRGEYYECIRYVERYYRTTYCLLVATVGLGVVAGIVFGGDTWFVGAVLDSLLDVVRTLGENGLVGLLVAAMLIGLLK